MILRAAGTASGQPDSTPGGRPAPAPRPAPPPPPIDSALGAACTASGGDAPDLLVVTFVPAATAADRRAAAKAIGGRLVGPSEHLAPGSWFIEVPDAGYDPAVADRLIVLPTVKEVSATRCPRMPRPTQ